MDWVGIQLGELITISIIAVVLGMDAFSLCVGMGMSGIRLRNVVKVSAVIGIFHVIMPLVGMTLGFILTGFMGHIASYIGGFILILLGVQMLWHAYHQDKESRATPPMIYTTFVGLLLFSLTVSLDALTVGFSFAIFNVNVPLALTIFGIAGAFMSGCGLIIGRQLGNWVGSYGNMLGGFVLLIFGIKFLL